jgi:hypothetical protein
MATANLILDLESNIDTDKILSEISLIKGVKEVFVRPKTKTEELLERMEQGEDIDDNEYFASIPGFLEQLDESSKTPISECIPIEEVWEDWNDL